MSTFCTYIYVWRALVRPPNCSRLLTLRFLPRAQARSTIISALANRAYCARDRSISADHNVGQTMKKQGRYYVNAAGIELLRRLRLLSRTFLCVQLTMAISADIIWVTTHLRASTNSHLLGNAVYLRVGGGRG